MIWNPNNTSAQNLQKQQFLFDQAAKVFAHSAQEFEMFMGGGSVPQFRDLSKHTPNGTPIRVDVQTGQATYMAARGGDDPWLPGSDPSYTSDDVVPTPTTAQKMYYAHEAYMQVNYRDTAKVAVKNKEGGYVNLLEFLISDAGEGLRNRMALKLAGSAKGYLAKLKSAGTAGAGYTDCAVEWAGEDGHYAGARNLLTGGITVDAVDSSGNLRTGTNVRARHIVQGSVARDIGTNAAGVTFTLKNGHGGTWTAGDHLALFNERPVTAPTTQADFRNLPGFIGLLDVVGDSTDLTYIGDLQRSTNQFTEALVFRNSGTLRALTLDLINFSLGQFDQLTGKSTQAAYGRPPLMREMAKFLTNTVAASNSSSNPARYESGALHNGNAKVGVPGLDIMPLGGRVQKWVPSPNAPTHTLFFLNPSEMSLVMDGGPVSLDPGGDIRVPGKASYQRAMRVRGVGLIARWEMATGVRLDDLIGDHVTA